MFLVMLKVKSSARVIPNIRKNDRRKFSWDPREIEHGTLTLTVCLTGLLFEDNGCVRRRRRLRCGNA